MPDNDIRLVDTAEGVEDVKPGEPGEIILRGPVVSAGLLNNPRKYKNQHRDGWVTPATSHQPKRTVTSHCRGTKT
jgi:long-chain acyl-CoA synthetase